MALDFAVLTVFRIGNRSEGQRTNAIPERKGMIMRINNTLAD
jgi:hypothetical protein